MDSDIVVTTSAPGGEILLSPDSSGKDDERVFYDAINAMRLMLKNGDLSAAEMGILVDKILLCHRHIMEIRGVL